MTSMKIDSDEYRAWAKKSCDDAWKEEFAIAKEEYDELQDYKLLPDEISR